MIAVERLSCLNVKTRQNYPDFFTQRKNTINAQKGTNTKQ